MVVGEGKENKPVVCRIGRRKNDGEIERKEGRKKKQERINE